MDEAAKLKRDIETLRESIRQDWQDIATLPITGKEKSGIVHHAKWCAHELNFLILKLESLPDA